MTHDPARPPVALLYVPASNARALDKARGLSADMVIIDLEDAVQGDRKAEARAAMVDAVRAGFPGKLVAVRINGAASPAAHDDLVALTAARPDLIVVPKVESIGDLDAAAALAIPMLAMIETPAGVFAAPAIAAADGVAGLIAGLNDLAHALRLPDGRDRGAMSVAIQTIILAARASGRWVFDGVWNAIDDAAGFAAEAADGRRLGFDGKTLIHPGQIAPCHAAFAPTAAEVEEAAALVEAAGGGAERFRGRMVEDMHVAAAKALLTRAGLSGSGQAGNSGR